MSSYWTIAIYVQNKNVSHMVFAYNMNVLGWIRSSICIKLNYIFMHLIFFKNLRSRRWEHQTVLFFEMPYIMLLTHAILAKSIRTWNLKVREGSGQFTFLYFQIILYTRAQPCSYPILLQILYCKSSGLPRVLKCVRCIRDCSKNSKI